MHWFTFNLHDFTVSFLSILLEGVPFMLIGTLISGVIDSFVPAEAIERRLPKNATAAIAVCGVLGTILPMCECGVVPVIRRMLKKGLPVSSAMAYLLAAPIVNIVVAVSTFSAFRGQNPGLMTSLRLSLGFVVAFLVAHLVHRLPLAWVLNRNMYATISRQKKHDIEDGEDANTGLRLGFANKGAKALVEARESSGFLRKIIGAIRCAAYDFLDIGFYLILGAAIASVFNTAVARESITPLASDPAYATAAMMGLAMLLSLCSTSDAFIAANFVAFPFVAKLGFLVLGPMMDLKLLFMYQMVFRKRFICFLTLVLFLLIGYFCQAIHQVLL